MNNSTKLIAISALAKPTYAKPRQMLCRLNANNLCNFKQLLTWKI